LLEYNTLKDLNRLNSFPFDFKKRKECASIAVLSQY